MKLKYLLGLGVIASFLLSACSSKGPDYTRYIPKSSAYVVALDVKSMMIKLDEDSLTIENMLEVLKDENNKADYTKALEVWTQFKDAGIDFENKVLVAVPDFNYTSGDISFQVVAGVKDAAKLEAFVSKQPNAPKVKKDGDLSIVDLSSGVAIGWNKKAVMIVGKQSTPSYSMMDEGDTATVTQIPGAEGLQADIKKYFDLKKEESIASVKEATDLIAEKADIGIFTSNTATSEVGGPGSMLTKMPKIKELLDGVYSTTTVNFEKGKVVVNGKTYAGKKLAELLSKYTGPVADMSLIERYPSNNINGIFAFSFKPETVPALLKETGFDAFVNMMLAEGGTTIEDIAKAFKGDFAVIFSDFAMKVQEAGKDASYRSIEPEAKLLFAARIGDKAAFDKLIALAEKTGEVRRVGNKLVMVQNMGDGQAITTIKPPPFVAGIENGLFIVSSDSAVYANYVAGKTSANISATAQAAIKNQSSGFYLNIPAMLNSIPDNIFDTTEVHPKNILNRSREVFGEMYFNTANFDGKKIDSKGELTILTGKNSLPQLVRYLMFVAEEIKQQNDADEVMVEEEKVKLEEK
ncbi:MAG TPA: DUF4836 family protein [Phnomibacter sp.]|nr:DUF4836 family protein [Phnomibacter sp.]